MRLSDELTRVQEACGASAKGSAERLQALHAAAKLEAGQELVQQMLAYLLVSIEWFPRLFAEAAEVAARLQQQNLPPRLVEFANAQMLGNLMQLPTALTISRKKELAEILGVLGDESVGFLLGFLWKVTKIAKKLVAAWNLKEEQLSKYEELVQWGRDWNAVLMTTTCNIALLTDQYKQFTTATSPEASVARLQGLHEAYLSEVHKMLTRLRAGA